MTVWQYFCPNCGSEKVVYRIEGENAPSVRCPACNGRCRPEAQDCRATVATAAPGVVCLWCGKELPQKSREDKRYCNDACRYAKYDHDHPRVK